jgi:SHS2 domain-containing protein
VVHAEGHDLISLLFAFLDTCLFEYGSDYFIGRDVRILSFRRGGVELAQAEAAEAAEASVDAGTEVTDEGSSPGAPFRIVAALYGELFDPSRHMQGTEIKAITYSNMQIYEGRRGGVAYEVHSANDAVAQPLEEEEGEADGEAEGTVAGERRVRAPLRIEEGKRRSEYDVYVIVDI